MTSSIARCIFKCGGKDSRLCQEAKRNYLQLFKLVFTSQESGQKSGTHTPESEQGWMRVGWTRPVVVGRACRKRKGRKRAQLWRLSLEVGLQSCGHWAGGLCPWGGLGDGCSPREVGSEWGLASSWALGYEGQAQSQGPPASGVEEATKHFWDQEAGVRGPHLWGATRRLLAPGGFLPAPDETCHTTADTRAPETTRTPGQAATGPRRTGHPCGVCERGSPSTVLQMCTHPRGPEGACGGCSERPFPRSYWEYTQARWQPQQRLPHRTENLDLDSHAGTYRSWPVPIQ